MSSNEQFESYKRRREIELLENSFRDKAAEKQKRLDEEFEAPEDSPGIDSVEATEFEDFLSESSQVLSDVLRDDDEPEVSPGFAPARRPAPEPAPSGKGRGAPLDLKAALARIQQQGRRGGTEEPSPPVVDSAPPPPAEPRRALSRDAADARHSFDEPRDDVVDSSREKRQAEERSLPPQDDLPSGFLHEPSPRYLRSPSPLSKDPPLPGPSARVRSTPPRAAMPPAMPEPRSPEPPPAPPPEPAGGSPAGVTNVFESEPGEDRDIDDGIEDAAPAGWDLPVRPPPPGAWVVAKQKEEGEAGLAGSAGDTYLIKKLCQEVRGLNRLYLVLIEKKVVSREEVEGPIAVRDRDPGAEDDEDFSVEDYSEDRYRPILIDEKDFSLSSLVADVHRLKALRETLVKKGIVSKKDLER